MLSYNSVKWVWRTRNYLQCNVFQNQFNPFRLIIISKTVKCVFRFSLQFLFETFFVALNTEGVVFQMPTGTHRTRGHRKKCPLFFSDFNQKWMSQQILLNPQMSNLSKISLAVLKMLHADRPTF
jgi:hypothetical protein